MWGVYSCLAFAHMGSAYAARISRNPRPKVGLLSNGGEAYKGTPEIVEAHRRLATDPVIDFIGNVEGVDLPHGRADVVVTGGFTGNVVLKMLEGISETVTDVARYAYRSKLAWKVATASAWTSTNTGGWPAESRIPPSNTAQSPSEQRKASPSEQRATEASERRSPRAKRSGERPKRSEGSSKLVGGTRRALPGGGEGCAHPSPRIPEATPVGTGFLTFNQA